MTDRIEGKVAQILTERSLAFNRGSDHGVEVGMRFAVLNAAGVEIVDPDTHEVLDSVELAKTIVKVVSVKPRLSVAQTFRKVRTRGGPFAGAGGSSLTALVAPATERPETLRSTEPNVEQELSEEESYIKIGDPIVELTTEDDFEGITLRP